MSFRDITVVHGTDAVGWWDYIKKHFRADETDLVLEPLDVSSLGEIRQPAELEFSIRYSHVVVLLVTSDLMTYMEEHADWLSGLLRSRDKDLTSLLSVSLCISNDEIGTLAQNHSYDLDSWDKFELNEDGSNVVSLVTRTLYLLDVQTYKAQRKLKDEKPSSGTVHIVPEMAPQEAGEKAVLIFSKEIKGEITIEVVDAKSPQTVICSPLNPYCVTFSTPEIEPESTAVLHIREDGEIKWTISWPSRAPAVSSVDLLCQAYDLNNERDLDQTLTRKFKDSHSSHVDDLTQHLRDQLTSEPRTTRYPSILHWAAANGLQELTAAILTTAAGSALGHVTNSDSRSPAQMASLQGHRELADFIEQTLETNAFAEACEIYVTRNSAAKTSDPADSDYEVVPPKPVPPRTLPVTKASVPQARKAFTLPRQSSEIPPIPTSSSKTPPPLPPRKSSSSGSTSGGTPVMSPQAQGEEEEEEDNSPLYLDPDAVFPEYVEQEWLPDHPAALGSRGLAELISMGDGVKTGKLSVSEAEQLFRAWKTRLGSGRNQSYKERKNQLATFRDEYRETLCSIRETCAISEIPKNLHGHLSRHPSTSSDLTSPSVHSPSAPTPPSSQSPSLTTPTSQQPPAIPRRKLSSSNKPTPTVKPVQQRDSQMSTQSSDSGLGSSSHFEDTEQDTKKKRQSHHDRYLQLLTLPEHPPPAVPARPPKQMVYSREKPAVPPKSTSKKKK